jgi:hypothetical protein
MNHQPYDTWMLESENLTREQRQELRGHIEGCPKCREIQSGWHEARGVMKRQPMAVPVQGFTQRWQLNLPARRELHQRKQLWRFFLWLAAAAFISLGVLGIQIATVESPVLFILRSFQEVVNFCVQATRIIAALASWIRVIPPVLTLAVGLGMIASFAMIFFVWIYMLRRITKNGGLRNEVGL